jgi:hypothetical protein
LPYPRRLLWDILPQNTPNSQNLLQRCPPTDFTDLHRYLGCAVLPQNTPNSQNLLLRCPPTDFTDLHRYLGCAVLPRNTPNSQNLLLRCPPTDFTDLHRYLGCAVLPQNSQNTQNLAAWVWQGCHTLLHLCSSVPSVGGSSLQEVSVCSVRSVGISFLPRISQIYTDT